MSRIRRTSLWKWSCHLCARRQREQETRRGRRIDKQRPSRVVDVVGGCADCWLDQKWLTRHLSARSDTHTTFHTSFLSSQCRHFNSQFCFTPRVLGGKGGFESRLHSSNNDSCRAVLCRSLTVKESQHSVTVWSLTILKVQGVGTTRAHQHLTVLTLHRPATQTR